MKEINFIIIIPVYNAEQYLNRTVASVTSQSYTSWRMILVNDGSEDSSPEICERFVHKDNRIAAVHQKNQGQLSARMNGIRYARTHLDTDHAFFLFLDADDVFVQGAFDRIADLIKQYRCDLLFFQFELRDASTDKAVASCQDKYRGLIESRRELYRKVLFDYQYNSVCRKAVSADLINDRDLSELYHIRHGEDLLQSMEYYRRAERTYFTNEVLYLYYQNMTSVTHRQCVEDFQFSSEVRRRVWETVTAENALDAASLREYSRYNCKLLRQKISTICVLKGSYQDKADLFDAIQKDEFYRNVLKDNPRYDDVISLLVQRRYRLMIHYVRIRTRIARVVLRIQS